MIQDERESGVSIEGQSQTTAHELYGHASLYIEKKPHTHQINGTKGHNSNLVKKITNATKETIDNMEERNNAK